MIKKNHIGEGNILDTFALLRMKIIEIPNTVLNR